jgi:hypothetical protein
MNEKKRTKYRNLADQSAREPMRPRNSCVGKMRHCRDCVCGRPRALVRHGRRWHRLGGCWCCLAGSVALSNTLTSLQTETDRD